MSDVGPGSSTLILKRITTEIARLNAQISQQELQVMELDDQKQRLIDNIEASKQALAKKESDLALTEEQHKGK
jgi:hypothetical protein